MTDFLTLLQGDALTQLKTIPDGSVQCCVTSPPYYGLRSYLKPDSPGKAMEIGAEETPQAYVDRMVEVFREVRRVLREDGTLWLNLGDSYNAAGRKGHGTRIGHKQQTNRASAEGVDHTRSDDPALKPKDLLMIPERVALALQADGWYLRAKCPWIKRNPMPESAKDRPTTVVETVFLFSKSERYHYDAEAVKVAAVCGRMRGPAEHADTISTNGNGGLSRRKPQSKRSRRSSDWFFESWQGMIQDETGEPLAIVVNPVSYKGAHFACFPPNLVRPCLEASASKDSVVLDPFGGSGTTAQVSLSLGMKPIVIELNSDYIPLIRQRCGIAA